MTVSSAVWRDQLTAPERAALGRADGRFTIGARTSWSSAAGSWAWPPRPRATRPGSARCC